MIEDFPIDAFPAKVAGYLRNWCDRKNNYPEMAAGTLLGVASHALQGRLFLKIGNKRTRANLMSCTCGPPGSGKESCQEIIDVVLEHEKSLRDEFVSRVKPGALADIAEAESDIKSIVADAAKNGWTDEVRSMLAGKHRDLQEAKDSASACPQEVVENYTVAALQNALVTNDKGHGGSVLIATTEAREFVDNLSGKFSGGRYSEETPLLGGYDGKKTPYIRKGDPIPLLVEGSISMAILVQTDKVEALFNQDTIVNSGLFSRILLCSVARTPRTFEGYVGTGEPADDYVVWRQLIMGLIREYRMENVEHDLTLSADAFKIVGDFYDAIESRITDATFAEESMFAVRWVQNYMRIIVVLHAMEHGREAHKHEISAETANGGRAIMNYYINQSRDWISARVAKAKDDKLAEITKLIRSKPCKAVTVREVVRSRIVHPTPEAERWLRRQVGLGILQETDDARGPKGTPVKGFALAA